MESETRIYAFIRVYGHPVPVWAQKWYGKSRIRYAFIRKKPYTVFSIRENAYTVRVKVYLSPSPAYLQAKAVLFLRTWRPSIFFFAACWCWCLAHSQVHESASACRCHCVWSFHLISISFPGYVLALVIWAHTHSTSTSKMRRRGCNIDINTGKYR